MKYSRRQSLTEQQGAEIYPIIDRALELPFGKAIVFQCSATRANYLARVITGERARNAIESIVMYTPDDYLYGKGLYYHVIAEAHYKGLIVAHVENPPDSLVQRIIRCAATKSPVPYLTKYTTAKSRLARMKERYPEILGPVYIDEINKSFHCAVVKEEELIVVDIDVNPAARTVPAPTEEERAKPTINKKFC